MIGTVELNFELFGTMIARMFLCEQHRMVIVPLRTGSSLRYSYENLCPSWSRCSNGLHLWIIQSRPTLRMIRDQLGEE